MHLLFLLCKCERMMPTMWGQDVIVCKELSTLATCSKCSMHYVNSYHFFVLEKIIFPRIASVSSFGKKKKKKEYYSDVYKVLCSCLSSMIQFRRPWELKYGVREFVYMGESEVYVCAPRIVASFPSLQNLTITGKHQQRASEFNSGWVAPGGWSSNRLTGP